MGTIELLNADCMTYMAGCEDNAFDLAICDPPYRAENQPDQTMRKYDAVGMKEWARPPEAGYFDEVQRVSRDLILWGGNYFTEHLPPNNNWIVWYKNNDGTHLSMAELAWSSIRRNVKVFELRPMGLTAKFHPTSKPVALYTWLLVNYAKPGQRILDTHLGSGSSAIAAHYFGCDFVGTELDPDYYAAAVERFNNETSQAQLFEPEPEQTAEQGALL